MMVTSTVPKILELPSCTRVEHANILRQREIKNMDIMKQSLKLKGEKIATEPGSNLIYMFLFIKQI